MDSVRHIPTIILGAGPSGTTCGYLLVKGGGECLLIDKMNFPRDKTCGGGLTPKTYRLINQIFENLSYDYLSIHRMQFGNAKGIFVNFNLDSEIRNVVREDFDHVFLHKYIDAGGEFKVARIVKIEEKNNKKYLYFTNGEIFSCDTLVGADGVNSFVRKYLQPSFPRKLLMMEKKNSKKDLKDIVIYFDKKYKNGYTYIFPNSKGTVTGYGHLQATLAEFDEEIARFHLSNEGKTKGAYIPALDALEYTFRKDIILIGDAGAYVDSVTGEGLYYAVKTGQNAAVSILSGREFKVVNERIIKKVRKLNRISCIFYKPYFQSIFYRVCSQKYLHSKLNKVANYYINR